MWVCVLRGRFCSGSTFQLKCRSIWLRFFMPPQLYRTVELEMLMPRKSQMVWLAEGGAANGALVFPVGAWPSGCMLRSAGARRRDLSADESSNRCNPEERNGRYETGRYAVVGLPAGGELSAGAGA